LNRRIFKTYLLIGFLFSGFLLKAQDQTKADSLINIFKNYSLDDSSRLLILKNIAFFHTSADSNIFYSKLLINEATQLSNSLFIAKGYFQLAYGHRLLGNYDEAIKILFSALKEYEILGDRNGVASSLNAIGDIYNVNNNHSNSIVYYKKAIAEFRQLNDSIELATALLNTGDEYFNHNDLDSALAYLLESKDIFLRKKYEIGVAYALGNIGLVYAKFGINDFAEDLINQATLILEKLGDRYPIAVYQTYMADIYKEKGELIAALEYAQKSLLIAVEEGLKEQIRDASLKLSELYMASENYEKAFDYQSQYLAYRDSINNEETIRKIANLRTEYEVSQKQIEVDLLNKVAENHRFLVINLILMVLLITALAYLYYHRSQVRLRINQLKSTQKLEIESQRDQLSLLNETKDKFFSIISHDLRGPVGNFKGVSSIMKMMLAADDKDNLIKLSEQLDKSASELTTLLDSLLQWALSQQGHFPHKPEKIGVYELIYPTFGVLENLAKSKKIELTHFIAGEIYLFVDKNSTETIIRNLLSNALKFTPSGGKVSLIADISANMVEIIISDTGVGISKEKLTTLFDFSSKRSEKGTSGEKGIGLGLVLVKDFVSLNGGSIRVESNVGEGTTFTIYLPLFL